MSAADRADLLLTMNRYRDAETAAREAVAADPELAVGYVHLARALAGQGRHDEAAAACTVGIGKAPQWGWPVAVLAWIRSDQKRFKEAIRLLHDALRLNPWDAFAHGQMAYALRESGRPRAARDAALEGLKIAPEDDFLLAQFGWCDKTLGKLKAAQARPSAGWPSTPTRPTCSGCTAACCGRGPGRGGGSAAGSTGRPTTCCGRRCGGTPGPGGRGATSTAA